MDFYQLLGIPYTASGDDIKRAYKKLAIKYHPDKNPNKEDHQKFIEISEAYETLRQPDKKKEYDLKHNIRYRNYTAQQASGAKPQGHSSYYAHRASAFFTQFYRPYFSPEDLLAKEREAHNERARRDAERDAYRAAQLAKERAEAALRNLKEEQTRIVHETRQREQRKREEKEKLYRETRKNTHQKHWGEPFKTFDEDIFRTKVYRNPTSDVREGDVESYGDPQNPIVVDDDVEVVDVEAESKMATEEAENQEFARSETEARTSASSSPQESEDSGAHSEEDTYMANESAEPERTEEARRTSSEDAFGTPALETPVSPENRDSSPDYNKLDETFDKFMKREPPKTKKKAFRLDDLRSSLGADIGDVDFSEVLDSLPDYGARPEQPQTRIKKPKLAEFSNGTSSADTLHIHVNKNTVHGHPVKPERASKLTMLDFNASPAIKTIGSPQPPQISLGKSITKQKWDRYVKEIHEYQREYLQYRRNVAAYMVERAARDHELFDEYNSDYKAFEVHQRCVKQDLDVMQYHQEALRQYCSAMDVYKQNCNWMKMVDWW